MKNFMDKLARMYKWHLLKALQNCKICVIITATIGCLLFLFRSTFLKQKLLHALWKLCKRNVLHIVLFKESVVKKYKNRCLRQL